MKDMNINCDLRDKIWTDIKIMDPKTGAYIVWNSYGMHPRCNHHIGSLVHTTRGLGSRVSRTEG